MMILIHRRQRTNGVGPETADTLRQKPHDIAACEDLRIRFVQAAFAHPADAWTWWRVWRLLVDDPWYQSQLEARACWVVVASGSSLQWVEDVTQDAILILARNLRRTPHLGADPLRVNEHFTAWMRGMMTRHCSEALRRIHRLHLRDVPSACHEIIVDHRQFVEERIDLSLAVDTLPDFQRAVVSLRLKGLSAIDIADALQIHPKRVTRACHQAVQSLQKKLSCVAK
jgi:RNA polymerase sigma factor (sigma-70 family)